MTTELSRRLFLAGVGAAALPLPASAQSSREMLIVNALGGIGNPNAERGPGAVPRDPRRPIEARVIADARASGMNVVNQTIGYVAGEGDPFERTMRDIGLWQSRFRAQTADLMPVLSAADMLAAQRSGKIGIILGFQNGAMMGDDASRVEIFADLGIRIIQLTYNPANQLGDGSMAPQNRGLSAFGREVIAQLNRNRLMVDLSHSGERTCLEAARASTRPISINHTGCRALTDLPRNKTDAELRLVGERGGFVGIYFMPFLNPRSVATPEDVVAHIEHAVNVCGEDHVGIGTDVGTTAIDDLPAYRTRIREEIAQRRAAGIGAAGENPDTLPFVERLSGPNQFRDLIRLLEGRRHPARRIEKIMGLNFLNHSREIWGA